MADNFIIDPALFALDTHDGSAQNTDGNAATEFEDTPMADDFIIDPALFALNTHDGSAQNTDGNAATELEATPFDAAPVVPNSSSSNTDPATATATGSAIDTVTETATETAQTKPTTFEDEDEAILKYIQSALGDDDGTTDDFFEHSAYLGPIFGEAQAADRQPHKYTYPEPAESANALSPAPVNPEYTYTYPEPAESANTLSSAPGNPEYAYTNGSGYDNDNADDLSGQTQGYTYPVPGGGYNSPLPTSPGPASLGPASSGAVSPGHDTAPAAAAPPSRRRGRAKKAATSRSVASGSVASGSVASGSVASGPVTSGSVAAGSVAAGSVAVAAAAPPSRRRGRASNAATSGSVSSRSASPAAKTTTRRRGRAKKTETSAPVSAGSVSAAPPAPTASAAPAVPVAPAAPASSSLGLRRRLPSILDHPDPWACPICFHCCCVPSSVKTHLLDKHPELGLTKKSLEEDPQFAEVQPLSFYRNKGLDVTYHGNDRKQVNARRRMDAGMKTNDAGYLDNVYKQTPYERKAARQPQP
ncbi:hypothetical protein A1O3_07424 [Capronia epimyces CBS 606.96]|uniref:Uncharacterized protein n=1 Tax=Capronia epimyces CBS 606.96 TaxID=1182542 RepID=W9XVU7_9EURO|nr:uncharacterized protein A1O3_07424 [Capronia epimyces CBS 606.96]EXJ81136.1 hypothetical protein A1O3_07424 [Capronia epimyces CBS 606.96]